MDVLRIIYALAGLLTGLTLSTFGLYVLLRGIVDRRGWCFRVGVVEFRGVGPGIAFAALGVLVIYITRP